MSTGMIVSLIANSISNTKKHVQVFTLERAR